MALAKRIEINEVDRKKTPLTAVYYGLGTNINKPLNSQPALPELVDEVDEIGHQPTRLVDHKSPTRLNYLTNQSVIS